MTYLVLARKWRPRSFESLVGQEHVVRALTHALDTQRLHHAWLFTGTRGVGKTTLSRILAKSLNCEQGVSAHACGVCSACTEIDAGRFVDYLELDAASNRGVEEMTQLLEQAVYAPSVGRYKVYMIDEVHMLTGHAFNAMLKTLEEPPAHVKFILATTDPQKIPVTVLSRCLQFNLKQMPADAIVEHLQSILTQEGLEYELPALRMLAQAARGSMRDALSLTDQAIAYSAGQLSETEIRTMLGTIDQTYLVRLLDGFLHADAQAVMGLADELATRSLSYKAALSDLAVLLSDMAIAQKMPHVVSANNPLRSEVLRLAESFSAHQIQLIYAVCVRSFSELAYAPDEHAGFIMACMRCLTLLDTGALEQTTLAKQPVRPVSAPVVAPSVGLDSELVRDPVVRSKVVQEAVSSVSTELLSTELSSVRPSSDMAKNTLDRLLGRAAKADQSVAPVLKEEQAQPSPKLEPQGAEEISLAPAPQAPSELEIQPLEESGVPTHTDFESVLPTHCSVNESVQITKQSWPTIAAQLNARGITSELAQQTEFVSYEAGHLVLKVATKTLAEVAFVERLEEALSGFYNFKIRVDVELGQTGTATARAEALLQQEQRQKAAEQSIQQDTQLNAMLDMFSATITSGSIKPRVP